MRKTRGSWRWNIVFKSLQMAPITIISAKNKMIQSDFIKIYKKTWQEKAFYNIQKSIISISRLITEIQKSNKKSIVEELLAIEAIDDLEKWRFELENIKKDFINLH